MIALLRYFTVTLQLLYGEVHAYLRAIKTMLISELGFFIISPAGERLSECQAIIDVAAYKLIYVNLLYTQLFNKNENNTTKKCGILNVKLCVKLYNKEFYLLSII